MIEKFLVNLDENMLYEIYIAAKNNNISKQKFIINAIKEYLSNNKLKNEGLSKNEILCAERFYETTINPY
jgi:metal-responsive CopG/Arc/MetJ family transcriptional regulator